MLPKKTIGLVRHGQTRFNHENLLQGRIDIPLNGTGRKESRRLSRYLKTEPVDSIFSSPLARSLETSELINRHHGVLIEEDASLVEIDFGEWEGRKYPDVFLKHMFYYQRWLSDPKIPIPGGESFFQVCERVKSFVSVLLEKEFTYALVVSHATVTRAILTHLFNLDLSATRKFRMNNCGLSKILIIDDPPPQRPILDSWNYVVGR